MLSLAWTTTATRADAEQLANGLLSAGLVSCVQIDGPVRSIYRWQGKVEAVEEHRLMLKLPSDLVSAAEAYLNAHHPYETPEWVAVAADRVSEKYLSWSLSTLQADRFQP